MTPHEQPSKAYVRKVLERHANSLMRYPNVSGVGIQDEILPSGKVVPVIQVYVTKKLAPEVLAPSELLPKELDGVKVSVREVGKFRFG